MGCGRLDARGSASGAPEDPDATAKRGREDGHGEIETYGHRRARRELLVTRECTDARTTRNILKHTVLFRLSGIETHRMHPSHAHDHEKKLSLLARFSQEYEVVANTGAVDDCGRGGGMAVKHGMVAKGPVVGLVQVCLYSSVDFA